MKKRRLFGALFFFLLFIALSSASVHDVSSVYNRCNQHPEQFNMNKGKQILADSGCMGSCYIEKIIIYGTSMNPLIYDGDIVGIKHDTDYNLSVGSIVLFNSLGQNSVNGAYSDSILHRIVGAESGRAEIYIIEDEDILPISEGIKISRGSGDNFVAVTIPAEINEAIVKINGTEVTLKRPFYITKGDNNNEIGSACEIVPASMIKGVLVSMEQ